MRMADKPVYAGFSVDEARQILYGIRLMRFRRKVVLEPRRLEEEDRLWFRFHMSDALRPSFGFSRRDGFVRLAMRDVEAEGIINAYEPIFPTVGEALELVATMVCEAPEVSRMARYGLN